MRTFAIPVYYCNPIRTSWFTHDGYTGASIAALTLYDMLKSSSKGIVIQVGVYRVLKSQVVYTGRCQQFSFVAASHRALVCCVKLAGNPVIGLKMHSNHVYESMILFEPDAARISECAGIYVIWMNWGSSR